MGSQRASELAAALKTSNDDLIELVESLSDSDWALPCDAEGGDMRSVGIVAHHVAYGHSMIGGWIRTLVAGEPLILSGPIVDAINAEHAQKSAAVTQAETASLMRTAGARLIDLIAGLGDVELAMGEPAGRVERLSKVAQLHTAGHAAAIRKAIGR